MSDDVSTTPSAPSSPGFITHDAPIASSSSTAPFRSFPKTTFASVEYPGTVTHPSALLRVITQDDINACFNAPSTETRTLEMRYGGHDSNGVPVRGTRVPSQKLLLKVTKRRRRKDDGEDGMQRDKGKEREGAGEGVFIAEVVGPVVQTVRFRYMADYHYTPNPEGRVSQVVSMLKDLDYDAILDYSVPPLDETYVREITPPLDGMDVSEPVYQSTLDLQSLPVFSERRLPLITNFRNHPASIIENVEDERTGEIRKRMVNRTRFVGHTVIKIGHGADLGDVPKEPAKAVKDKVAKLDPRIVKRFQEILAERPIWLRHALLNQFTDPDRRAILRNKAYLPSFVYTFGAGPYWKTLVRYGYDPRQDPDSRQYQRIYFYINVHRPGRLAAALDTPEPDEEEDDGVKRTKGAWEAEQEALVAEGRRPPLDKSRAHIFDGQIIHRDHPDYQLCDITDPMIRKYIDDPQSVSDTCDAKGGWYKAPVMDLIKALTRIKYLHVREKNEPAPNSICYGAIEEYERELIRRQPADDEETGADGDQDNENEDVDMDE